MRAPLEVLALCCCALAQSPPGTPLPSVTPPNTASNTATPPNTPSVTMSSSNTPSTSLSSSVSATATLTASRTATRSATSSKTSSLTPSATASNTASPSSTASSTASQTPEATASSNTTALVPGGLVYAEVLVTGVNFSVATDPMTAAALSFSIASAAILPAGRASVTGVAEVYTGIYNTLPASADTEIVPPVFVTPQSWIFYVTLDVSYASPGYVPTTPWSVIQQLTASTIDVPPASNGLQAFATYLGSGATVVSVGVIGNASPDVLGSFRGDTFGKTYGAAVGGGVGAAILALAFITLFTLRGRYAKKRAERAAASPYSAV